MACQGCIKKPEVSTALDVLAKHKQRATYGAIAGRAGVIARNVMKDHDRDHRHAWIVGAKTGQPGGEHYPTPPDFPTGRSGVITKPKELESFISKNSPRKS